MSEGPEHPRRGRPDGSPPHEPDDAIADVFNGFTFGSKRRGKRRSEPDDQPRAPERDQPRAQPERREPPAREPERRGPPAPEPKRREPPAREPARPRDVDRPREQFAPQPPPAAEDLPAASVRSYAWTGGRTRSNHNFELETLVSTSESYRPGPMVRHEHESIADLCRQPRSVAEVGALLAVPVGVARVLLADMAELGWITVHQTVTEGGSAPHLMLMERVLSGLRRL
jgi:hypothetical protein